MDVIRFDQALNYIFKKMHMPINISQNEAQKILNYIDEDKDGKIYKG